MCAKVKHEIFEKPKDLVHRVRLIFPVSVSTIIPKRIKDGGKIKFQISLLSVFKCSQSIPFPRECAMYL